MISSNLANTETIMISLNPKKFTIKEVEELSGNADTLNNLCYSKSLMKIYDSCVASRPSIFGKSHIKALGKPNVTMRGYESNPGAWIFNDTDSQITWIMFSDGHKKNSFKGASYELILPKNISSNELGNAIRNFFNYLGFPSF